ncbi:MAG TPA: class I SAM-dependent methyltransferase [Roseiflexaceae bacterium]|nr:class I SAM-dependent methyltransferase [Roseiflexaceae bacterium]
MPNTNDYTAQNRRAWNEIAEVRHRKWPDAQFFAAGGSLLEPIVLEAAGDVHGLALLHLQCATGEDTLSWAVAGANVTGVDISDAQIALAQRKAADAGLQARFVAADVYALPAELQSATFDVVFTGGGALVWLPDIERWAAVVAAAMRPGGRLLLYEEHPLASCLWFEDGKLVMEEDYFARGQPFYNTGWRHFAGGEAARETKAEFQWTLGDIVTALARAGLRIERLEEFPSKRGWRFGERADQLRRLPGSFLLEASKA